MKIRLRSIVALTLCGVVLGACGLLGDDDDIGSPEIIEEVVVSSVRVEFGERWFDLDPDQVQYDADGSPSAATVELLEDQIANMSLSFVEPVNASIGHDGQRFFVQDSIDGEAADVETLARLITSAVDAGQDVVTMPTRAVGAEVTDETAAAEVAELNARTVEGITVSIDGQTATLQPDALGRATTVVRRDDDWAVSIDYQQIDAELHNLFADVGAPGTEAVFSVEPSEVVGEPGTVVITPGASQTICCDPTSARRIEQAIASDLEVATLLFERTDAERGTEWAEDLGIAELVGSFTTRYTPGQDRNINIRRIAELTQGVIIQPGETFSLNQHIGRRTTENGFVPAGTIVNGHLVDSVGGGISQFATTLFNAAFFSGLEYGAYQSHSIYFSRYPYGREATISWPAPALEINNPSPYAVLIWPTSTSSSVTVDLYSTKWADVEQTGQIERQVGEACTRVTTERTRTFVDDGSTDVDTVFATYRPEGIACDGTETQNPDEEDIEALEEGEDPGFDDENPAEVGADGVPPEQQPGAAGDPETPNPDADAPPPADPAPGDPAPAEPPPADPAPGDPAPVEPPPADPVPEPPAPAEPPPEDPAPVDPSPADPPPPEVPQETVNAGPVIEAAEEPEPPVTG